jgi:hypothetical protein
MSAAEIGHLIAMGPLTSSHSLLDRLDDLLDANESTWAFVFVGRVGWNGTLLLKALVMLGSIDGCRSYCGRTADEQGGLPARRYTGMDRAGPLPASQSRRRHGIASAHAICPSKPSVLAMSR